MVPAVVSEPATSSNAHTLEDVLQIAGHNGTEPFCSSYGPVGPRDLFAALVAAYNASGSLDAAWMSEPMFGTSQAALEHAEDVCGPEIWPIVGGCQCEW